MRWPIALFALSGFAALGLSFRPSGVPGADTPEPSGVFKARCISCHSGDQPAGRLDLSQNNAELAKLWIVAKGDPDHSLLIRRVTGKQGRIMPPSAPPLSDADIATLRAWISSLKPDPTPIFQAKCIKCHGGAHPAAALDLSQSLDGIAASRAVVIGNPDASSLYKRVSGGPGRMPAGGPPLSDEETATIKDWITSLKDPTPLFNGRCMPCHRGQAPAGGLNLALSPEKLAALPEMGKGDPDSSQILKRVKAQPPQQMPPGGHGLSDGEIAYLSAWIKG